MCRYGSAARHRTIPIGDHRNSALTTMPLSLTDDPAALARSLWFATDRGYAKALDSYLKVKTEQQVRAKEEDASADFFSRASGAGPVAGIACSDGRSRGMGAAIAGALRTL